jgi:hypothetical protein
MDEPSDVPTVTASRQLTIRELATIRAALRFWQAISGDEMAGDALAAAHAEVLHVGHPADVILDDEETEQLLVALALAGDVVVTALNPEAVDRRRI